MLKRVRQLDPLCAALALGGALALWMLSGTDPYWSDWGQQDASFVGMLLRGDLEGFMDGPAPSHLGSLLLRAPLFLLAGVLGGAEDEAFFAVKAVALLVLAGLAGWLLGRARKAQASVGSLLLIAFVTAASPIAGRALDNGHPEDLLAACCAIFGVLAARGGRPSAAGLLIGLGIVLKQWPILACLPAMAVAPRRPWRVLAVAAPVAASMLFLPLLLRGGGGVAGGLQTAAGDIWRAHQLFWPLGIDNPDPGALRPKLPPEWFLSLPRLLIVGLSVPLTALWWRHRRNGGGHPDDVLLLLALLFMGRCLFEPWNNVYYHLPFLLTLATWEVVRRRAAPVLTLFATGMTWFSFHTWFEFVDVYSDATYVMYMSWTLPLAFVLLRALLFPGLRLPALAGHAEPNAQGVQPASR